MSTFETTVELLGPWSLATSRAFWEGFAPAALPAQDTRDELRTVFLTETGWQRAEAVVTQQADTARIRVSGGTDLDAAAVQVARFLSLDVDGRGWPDVGRRDPVIGDAQRRLPGLRPCGFSSPYEAAAWAVLSSRSRITQAARVRDGLVARHGDRGAFPAPAVLRGLDLDLPRPKPAYLHAVADAALDGLLDASALRSLAPEVAVARVQQIHGLGPFAAELVVVRGANAPDALPRHERRLEAEVAHRYGLSRSVSEVAETWRPYRTWAAVHLRALREERARDSNRRSLA